MPPRSSGTQGKRGRVREFVNLRALLKRLSSGVEFLSVVAKTLDQFPARPRC